MLASTAVDPDKNLFKDTTISEGVGPEMASTSPESGSEIITLGPSHAEERFTNTKDRDQQILNQNNVWQVRDHF